MKTLIHTETKDGFTIKFYALEEFERPEDHFDPELEKEFDTFGKIERGELVWFCALAEASRGEIILAQEYLGGCCYESYRDFIGPDSYWTDMRAQVIVKAQQAIKKLCQEV